MSTLTTSRGKVYKVAADNLPYEQQGNNFGYYVLGFLLLIAFVAVVACLIAL